MSPRASRLTFSLFLAMLALGAMVMLSIATPAGAGLANDSVAYIAGARSILQGTGYSDIWLDSSLEAITHYPPLLSLTLAAIGALGIDPLRGARILNILLYGLNTALLGWLGWRMTSPHPNPSPTGRGARGEGVAGLLLAALFALNASLLRLHVFALSEPLFLFLSLLSFIFFDLAVESGRSKVTVPQSQLTDHLSLITAHWFLLTGFLTGLACLTRYSGLALLATFLLSIFLLNPTWRARLTKIALFLAGAVPPLAVWFIRNKLIAGNATNRIFQFHPITADNLQPGLYNFSQFLMPIEPWRQALVKAGAVEGLLLILGLVLLTWLSITAWKLLFPITQSLNHSIHQSPNPLVFTTALYLFAYLGAVLFSMSFFDASTKFQPRILAPVYVSLMVLFVAGLRALSTKYTKITKQPRLFFLRGLMTLFVISVLGLSIYDYRLTFYDLREAGQGYASWQWHDSLIMAELKKLPPEVAIYTNTPPAVYLVTGRASRVLPTPVDPVDNLPRGDYEQNVAQMRADLLAGRAVLALFDTSNLEDALGTQNVDVFTAGLTVLEKAQGDSLYGKP